MNQYLLSVHQTADAQCPSTMTMPKEEMAAIFQRIEGLESEMKASGALQFSGKLTEPLSATVVRKENGETLITDGPFAESKEHLGGFYIIQAKDLDAALHWAKKVTEVIGQPIEVRPFWSHEGR